MGDCISSSTCPFCSTLLTHVCCLLCSGPASYCCLPSAVRCVLCPVSCVLCLSPRTANHSACGSLGRQTSVLYLHSTDKCACAVMGCCIPSSTCPFCSLLFLLLPLVRYALCPASCVPSPISDRLVTDDLFEQQVVTNGRYTFASLGRNGANLPTTAPGTLQSTTLTVLLHLVHCRAQVL